MEYDLVGTFLNRNEFKSYEIGNVGNIDGAFYKLVKDKLKQK